MNSKAITIKNNGTSSIILPHIGGRLVSLTRNGSNNILSSDSSLWNYKFNKNIKEYTSLDILQFRGLSTWVGPQSEWWIHQDINQEKKNNKDTWPPDPFLDYGKFEILNQSNNSIELLGSKSEYTGVQIKKKYTVLNNGKIELSAEATNIRDEEISWDLWLNTRLPGHCRSYIPISDENIFWIETTAENEVLTSKIINGFFSFVPNAPSENFSQKSAKAFITPSKPFIFSFNANHMFVIHIDINHSKNIHPQHAIVEIYNAISVNNSESLLELEYHSPYKKIKHNENIKISETWELLEYNGGNTETEHIDFINKWINNIS